MILVSDKIYDNYLELFNAFVGFNSRGLNVISQKCITHLLYIAYKYCKVARVRINILDVFIIIS
jgi:hypothetical protein